MTDKTLEWIGDIFTFAIYRNHREGGMSAERLASPHLFGPELGAQMERRYWEEISAYVNERNKRDRETPQWLRDLKTGNPR